jgi:Asp-tRNA(Asn)/Glu-tRNA(Gln) amidotransferase A subunit family amidase
VQLPARLKFGFYLNDNLFTTSPACQRAVKETVAALRKAGHECIELDPPDAVECMRIFVALSSADGYEGLLSNLDGDPAEPSLFLITLQKKLGPTLMRWISKTAPGDAKLFSITEQAGEKRVIDVRRWQARRDDFVAKVRGQLWGDMQLDGIIG